MTIDERLDRLTERHEALTQSVEMLVLNQQKHETVLQKAETLLSRVIESIDKLANIAHAHEQRITRLEDQ